MTGTLEDREAIRDVIAAYAHAIDRRRWEMMETLFHDEAVFKFGVVEGDWRGFVDQARAIIDPCVATHHQLGQSLIAFAADGVSADCETYMTAMHIVPPGYPMTDVFPDRGENYSAVIAGRYVDRLEKRGGEWRIAQRTGLYDWREYRAIGEADLDSVPQEARGGHGTDDPSLAVAVAWKSKV